MTELKRWAELIPPGVHQHVAIIRFMPGRPSRLHRHDFPEVFWLERGTGIHWINGERKRLDPGDLVLVRPEDEHRLEAVDPAGFGLVNVAYAPSLRQHLLARYPDEMTGLLAPRGRLPFRTQLSPEEIFSLRRQLEQFGREPKSTLGLERFLLGLPALAAPASGESLPALPDWLQRACAEAQRPEVFAQGAAGLVKAAGRSAEHVARTVRAVFGLTPSAYVNRVRMDYAARQLRITAQPIADIALDCGVGNLSHFYALFRGAYGQTPQSYRRTHYRSVA